LQYTIDADDEFLRVKIEGHRYVTAS